MGISEREHHIKVLQKMFYSMEKLESGVVLPTSEVKTTLAYAISSLKTDLKYDLMYEGEEVFTKADVEAMLTELKTEIEEKAIRKQGVDSGFEYDYEFISSEEVEGIIQQKIDKLKGEQDG